MDKIIRVVDLKTVDACEGCQMTEWKELEDLLECQVIAEVE